MTDWTAGQASMALLAICAVGWYAATRGAMEALSAGASSPGRRAIAASLATGALAIIAIVSDHPDIAVGILFSSSVTALTLVLGIVTLSTESTATALSTARAPQHFWAFLLPVSLIALMIGFRGHIGWMEASVLLLEGIALASVGLHRSVATADVSLPKQLMRPTHYLLLLLSLVVAGISSYGGVLSARGISDSLNLPTAHLATALLLALAMLLPLIGWGGGAGAKGHYDQVLSVLVTMVLINLCALLPLASVLWMTRPALMKLAPPQASITTMPTTTSTAPVVETRQSQGERSLFFPIASWRVDTMILIAVGLLLLPVALGRWSLGTAEGYGLLLAYLAYMVLTTRLAR